MKKASLRPGQSVTRSLSPIIVAQNGCSPSTEKPELTPRNRRVQRPFPFQRCPTSGISKISKLGWKSRNGAPIFYHGELIYDRAEDASAAGPATGSLARSTQSRKQMSLASAQHLNRA